MSRVVNFLKSVYNDDGFSPAGEVRRSNLADLNV